MLYEVITEHEKVSAAEIEKHIFSEDYLLRRPLLEAISQDRAPVLLIDEIDRAVVMEGYLATEEEVKRGDLKVNPVDRPT